MKKRVIVSLEILAKVAGTPALLERTMAAVLGAKKETLG
jgi:hypothetical protein